MNTSKTIISSWVVCILIGAVPYEASGEKLYWRETHSANGTVIRRSDLDGTNIENLVTIPTAIGNSFGLALDLDDQKVYWAERENGKIRNANLDGSDPADVVTGLDLPLGIALDQGGGRVYWCQDQVLAAGVYRANLDGSGIEQVLGNSCTGIALDETGGKLYIVGGFMGPRRANLDGSSPEELIDFATFSAVFGDNVRHSIALDVPAGKMYFTAHRYFAGTTSSVGRADLDGSNPERVVSETDPGSLVGMPVAVTLDTGEGNVYWSGIDVPPTICRANTDGTGSTVVLTLTEEWAAMALALDGRPQADTPAISHWGVVSMTLLALIAGTVMLLRQRANLDYRQSRA